METVKTVCSALYGASVPILLALAVWNLVVFALYGADKARAAAGKWRIRESVLLWSAFLFGSAGAYLGMTVFRHKTKKRRFFISVPLFLVLHILLAGLVCRYAS